MAPDIEGKSIVVTRPGLQGQQLAQEIRRRGGRVVALPLIEIQELELIGVEKQKVIDLDRYDVIVVVSPNAAKIGLERIDQYWPQLPLHIEWYAVGVATANALASRAISAQVPSRGWDSEALLALPGLKMLQGKKILILKGKGGRTLLQEQFSARGARVETLDLYCRKPIYYSAEQILKTIGANLPDRILITSVEILENMHHSLAPCYDNLISVNLVTASERISAKAKAMGYVRIKTAEGASNEAMLAEL